MQLMGHLKYYCRIIARMLCVPALLGVLMVGLVNPGWATPLAQSPEQGQTIFQQKCTACHTIGRGKLVGPDLIGVTARRERSWLVRWIAAPDKMLAEKDPIAIQLLQEYNNVPMTNLGLTEAEVASLIAYLETQSTGAAAPPPAPAAVGPGDPVAGKSLFMGNIRFQNGGPPCMACHSVAGIGALGGGALGPDLTSAFSKFGEAGLLSILATVPFPTMNAVWTQHPLTPEEQTHLVAFLQQAVAERPTEALGQLALLAIFGTAVLLALAQLYWRNRLTAVRWPLVSRQPSAVSRQPSA